MKPIELIPNLEHCIETVARREYESALRYSLSAGDIDASLAERLQTLVLFLNETDFPALRAVSEPHLLNGKKVIFFVWAENGIPAWNMQVNENEHIPGKGD